MSNDTQFVDVYTTSIQSIHVNVMVNVAIQPLRRPFSSALLVQTMLQDESQRPSHRLTINLPVTVTGMILAIPAVATVPIQVGVEINEAFVNIH